MAGGRPSKLETQARKTFLAHLSEGMPKRFAAGKAGLDESTVYKWLKTGRKDLKAKKKSRHAEFFQAVKGAEADAVWSILEELDKAGPGTWQKYAWKLERMFPRDFGRASTTSRELDHDDFESPIDTLVESLKEMRIKAGVTVKS